MNETLKKFFIYTWLQIKAHPWATIVTSFNVAIFLVNSYALSFVDYNSTRQQTYANTQSISHITSIVSTDHDSITILSQIAKDNAQGLNNLSTELSTLNTNFTLFLENQKK